MRTAGRRGFTLVELIFVVVIIAIAAALAIPSVTAGRRQRAVRKTLQDFVSTVRQASATSIFKRQRVELRVWPDDGEYAVFVPDPPKTAQQLLEEEEEERRGRSSRLGSGDSDGEQADGEELGRIVMPELARFGEIGGTRSDDLEEWGTVSVDFFPTGSSSGGAFEFIFEEGRNRQVYLLKINPLVSSISMEEGS